MKTSLTDITKHLKSFEYGNHLRPGRDWYVLLGIAGLLLIVSVGWNLWVFSKVTNGESIGTAAPPAAVHSVKLDTVNALFERRAQEEAHYLNDYRFVDPSSTGR